MKKNRYMRKTTTVSCDEATRKFIAEEAERTGRLQREVLASMVKVYRDSQKRSATRKRNKVRELMTDRELFEAMDEKLEINLKRDDVVIGYIKKHESEISSPMFDKIRSCESLLGQLLQLWKES